MIRYELEKALFSGEIGTQDLEGAWNELYKKYLGITVPSAEMGVMQDMHWAYGYIGYFPTYALSSAFAAQFDNAMRKDIDVDLLLKNSRYKEIMDYLKENIQRYGALYNSDTILEKATGEKFNPDYYFNYLKTKYAVE